MKISQLLILTPFSIFIASSCSVDGLNTNGTGGGFATGGAGQSNTGGAGNASNSEGTGGTGSTPGTGGTTLSTGGSGNQGSGGSGDSGGSGGSGGSNVGGTATGGSTGGVGTGGSTGGTSTGGEGTGGSSDVPDPPPLQNPQQGRATHYWDCCKPSCAWPDQGSAKSCTIDNQTHSDPNVGSACSGGAQSGDAYQCWSMSPWAVSDTLAYGFAAFNEGSCGQCYQLEFTGVSSSGWDDPGSAAISNKIMIVQTLNRGGIDQGQFDLLVPGGGVGDFDACSTQWNATGNLGERYGGFFLECRNQNGGNHEGAKQCARNKCNEIFNEDDQAELLAGCLFWVDWAHLADNPNFNYGPVECPEAISSVSGM